MSSAAHPTPAGPQPPTRGFGTLVTAGVLSKLADQFLMFALPLAVLSESGSAGAAVAAFAVRGISFVASPLLGALADRHDRRRLYVLAQVHQAVFILLAALFLGEAWWVAAMIALSGLGGVVSSLSSYFVLIPHLVPQDDRARAVARFSAAVELAKVAGILGAGAVVGLFGGTTAILVNAVIYLAAAAVALNLPRADEAPRAHEPWRRSVAAGFGWLRDDRTTAVLVISMTLANLAIGAVDTVFVTLTAREGLRPEAGAALVASGVAVGALGAACAARLFARRTNHQRILAWQLLSMAGLLVMVVPQTASLAVGYAVICFSLGGSNVVSITLRQDLIPEERAGSVNSVIRMFMTGAVPLSGFVFASSLGIGGVLMWMPSLVLMSVSLAVWAVHTARSGNLVPDAAVER